MACLLLDIQYKYPNKVIPYSEKNNKKTKTIFKLQKTGSMKSRIKLNSYEADNLWLESQHSHQGKCKWHYVWLLDNLQLAHRDFWMHRDLCTAYFHMLYSQDIHH